MTDISEPLSTLAPQGSEPKATPTWQATLAAVGRYRALPVIVGTLILWIAVGIVGRGNFGGSLSEAASVAAFLCIVGLGQMFVVAAGSGNIDLSIPSTLTLGAYLGSTIANGHNGLLVPAGLAVIAFGVLVGAVNATVIKAFRVPPIVATLGVGFILESGYLELSSVPSNGMGSALNSFSTGRWGGVPYMAVLALACILVGQAVLSRSWFGRRVLALGQSRAAARLSGIGDLGLTYAVYMISGSLSALVGLLLGAYIGGGSLSMGTSYLLGSVAVVVLGGCLVSGGVANAPGVGIASVFLTLLITLTNLLHVSAGVQEIIEGLIIVVLLSVAGSERVRVE